MRMFTWLLFGAATAGILARLAAYKPATRVPGETIREFRDRQVSAVLQRSECYDHMDEDEPRRAA